MGLHGCQWELMEISRKNDRYRWSRLRPTPYFEIMIKRSQRVCKPGSVRFSEEKAVTIHLGCALPRTSCYLPGQRPGNRSYAAPIWYCSRRGLPCHCRYRQRGALLPHPFTLTPKGGGLLSVALSLESPLPGVTRRRVSVEPGLSSPICMGAATRPSDPFGIGRYVH